MSNYKRFRKPAPTEHEILFGKLQSHHHPDRNNNSYEMGGYRITQVNLTHTTIAIKRESLTDKTEPISYVFGSNFMTMEDVKNFANQTPRPELPKYEDIDYDKLCNQNNFCPKCGCRSPTTNHVCGTP